MTLKQDDKRIKRLVKDINDSSEYYITICEEYVTIYYDEIELFDIDFYDADNPSLNFDAMALMPLDRSKIGVLIKALQIVERNISED